MVTIVRREIRRRGVFGHVFKWIFILFNILMLLWLVSYWNTVAPMLSQGSEPARAGSAIGATVGTGFLVFFWAAGALILGLLTMFTRGKLTVIEERQE